AELGELRQLGANAVEAAPGAREELVPGAEARELAVDVDEVGLRALALGAVSRRLVEHLLDGQLPPEEDGGFGELRGEIVLAAFELAANLVLEGRDPVDPRLDLEAPEPGPVDLEGARPDVVAPRDERRLGPI